MLTQIYPKAVHFTTPNTQEITTTEVVTTTESATTTVEATTTAQVTTTESPTTTTVGSVYTPCMLRVLNLHFE